MIGKRSRNYTVMRSWKRFLSGALSCSEQRCTKPFTSQDFGADGAFARATKASASTLWSVAASRSVPSRGRVEDSDLYGHPAIQLGAGIDISSVSHRKPVNAISREGEARHV